MKPDVIVIGGGAAGLAAGTALAENGARVLLLEGRPRLGGRAYSFRDPETGDPVDNGQHMFMGCYHQTLKLLDRIGTRHLLDFQKNLEINFVEAGGRMSCFRCPPLPAPLHLLGATMRFSALSVEDKWRILTMGRELAKARPENNFENESVDALLTRWNQTPRTRSALWDVITLGTLNTDPRRATADIFVRVLKEIFMSSRTDSQIAFSKVGLSDLYADPAGDYIRSHGGEVRLECPVESLEIKNHSVEGITLRSGEKLDAETVVLAVPQYVIPRILPKDWAGSDFFRGTASLQSSPILGLNMWLEEEITPLPFVGMLGTNYQWLFNRPRFLGEPCQHISLVISACPNLAGASREELESLAIEELKALFGREVKPKRTLLIKEKRATLLHEVGTSALRPPHRTPIRNLLLAGDWTDTGLPCTVEGAVLSGHRCASQLPD